MAMAAIVVYDWLTLWWVWYHSPWQRQPFCGVVAMATIYISIGVVGVVSLTMATAAILLYNLYYIGVVGVALQHWCSGCGITQALV
jgi:hypothetical protein